MTPKKHLQRPFRAISFRIMLVAAVAMLMYRYIRPAISQWTYENWSVDWPA